MANIKIIISLKQKDSFIVHKVCKLLPKVHSRGGDGWDWVEWVRGFEGFLKAKPIGRLAKRDSMVVHLDHKVLDVQLSLELLFGNFPS